MHFDGRIIREGGSKLPREVLHAEYY